MRAGDPMTAFATGTSPALDTAANDAAARKPKTLTAPYAAISLNVVAKRPETPPAPHSTEAAMTASQSAQASDQRREPSFRFPASDAGNHSDYKIAAAVPSADPAQAPGPAVVLSSKTHFVPEAPRSEAMVSVAAQMATGASRQDQAKASRDFTQPRTKATSQAAQRPDTIADDPAAAEGYPENPTHTVSAPEQSATPSKRGGSSPDASAKDTASHRSASSGPTPAEAPRSSELSSSTALGSAGASAATPGQQILAGVQRAIPAADISQTSPGTLQPTLDGQQQPLKTITVALSPASLGNVAVELSLKSGRLDVKLQVEEPGTVQLLRQDGSLEKLLESAGYAVQSLSVHLSPQPNQPTQGQTTPNGQSFSNQFSPAGGGQEQGHSQSHKGQPEDRNADQKPGYGRTEDGRGGGSLYV